MVNNSMTGDFQPLFLNKSNSNTIFQVPSHFLERLGPVVPSKATLTVDKSGKEWRVSIEKFKDHYFFTDGWKEFAEQTGLKAIDFLVLKPGSSSNLNGTNKGKTTRGTNSVVNVTRSSIQNKNKNKNRSSVKPALSFTKQIREHHRYRMAIPKSMIMSIGLHKGDEMKLIDHEGREYPVHVTHGRSFSLGAGWCDFLIENKVMVGSTISFKLIYGKTLQAKILKMGTGNPVFNSTNTRETRFQDSDF